MYRIAALPHVLLTAVRPLRTAIVLAIGILLLLHIGGLGRAMVAQSPRPQADDAEGVALSAEASWTLRPTGWVSRPTTVSATVVDADGLHADSAAYRISTDGGGNWSDWIGGAEIAYSSPISTTVHMTATVAGFVDSATQNRVQFRIIDRTDNTEESPIHTVQVDGTPPTAPINLAAMPASWTNVDTFGLNWTNPSSLAPVVKAYFKIGDPPISVDNWMGAREGSNIQSISNVMLGEHGAQKVHVWLEDAAGNRNHQNYAQVDLLLDQVAPTSPLYLTVTPASWTSTNAFTLQWTNPTPQDAPISRAFVKFGTAPVNAGNYDLFRDGSGINQITNLQAPHTGEVVCYLWLGDQAGNVDHTKAVTTTLRYGGSEAPDWPFGLQIEPSEWTRENAFTATWANPTTPAGICAAWYKWGAPPANATDGTRVEGANIQTLPSLQAPNEGANTLHVWLEDCVGNRSHAKRRSISALLDTTPPQTEHSFSPPLPASGWFRSNVTVNLTATDAHSGVKQTFWREEGTLAKQGTSFIATDHTIVYQYWSVDHAGNEEMANTLTVPIDKEPPTSTLTLTPPEPASGWYAEPVTAQIAAEDTLSGWDGDTWYRINQADWVKGTQFALTESGVYTVTYYSMDRAGNQETTHKSRVIRVDRVPPTVTAIADKVGEFVRTPVVITIEASDDHSGIQTIEYRALGDASWTAGDTITIPDGVEDRAYTYDYRARDVAGNEASGRITVKIDTTSPPPPQNLSATPAQWVNYNDAFGVSWHNPVDMSGIAGVYYQLDIDPVEDASSATFVAGGGINSLSNLSAPSQGAHTLYLWLRDGAGNSDPYKRAVLPNAFRFDTTPPVCLTPTFEGTLGDNSFYTSAVTATLRAEDPMSGVALLRYRVNGGAWVEAPKPDHPAQGAHPVVLQGDGRQVIDYSARDAAENWGTVCSHTIHIDSTPPASPRNVTVTPSGWTASNNFALTWTNPDDYSMIAGVYIKKGEPPTTNEDGEFYPRLSNQTQVSGIAVDSQGEIPVYLWLKDRAGNVDKNTAFSTTLRFDNTPPSTTLIIEGAERNTYYISAVAMRFDASDNASGVATTRYRINGAANWSTWEGQDIILDREGVYTVTYYSIDHANNQEAIKTSKKIEIDLRPPTSSVRVRTDYVGATGNHIEVSWSGADSMSGVERYDVQYRRGGCSQWVNWRMDTANTTDQFSGLNSTGLQANNFYYFRARAKDKAGWVSDWSAPTQGVYKEGLGNPDFEMPGFGAWVPGGDLGAYLVNREGPHGTTSRMVRLSKPEWQNNPSQHPLRNVPFDAQGSIWQTIPLPRMDCDQGVLLSFWYKIEGYDTLYGIIDRDTLEEDFIDTFDVHVYDANNNPLRMILRDGIPDRTDPNNITLKTLPWKQALIDLTPWAGQTIRIRFEMWNRHDDWYPTWVYIDDVRLLPSNGRIMRLPLVLRNTRAGLASPAPIIEPTPRPLVTAPDLSAVPDENTPPQR